MAVSRNQNTKPLNLKIKEVQIKKVRQFEYLNSKIIVNGRYNGDMDIRIYFLKAYVCSVAQYRYE